MRAGGAGELAGLMIGDYITDRGQRLGHGRHYLWYTFGALLPTDKEVPLKLRFSRFV